uniref:Uncharacterized protein n=1 Tax=Melanopsichium pennsylvanicum 4 TaxID=1398559 RepID=A0A077RCR3_9BASI|nr:uncharacterized protein BN887_06202 [Melanopsichium pennsylvanicum 4]
MSGGQQSLGHLTFSGLCGEKRKAAGEKKREKKIFATHRIPSASKSTRRAGSQTAFFLGQRCTSTPNGREKESFMSQSPPATRKSRLDKAQQVLLNITL